MERFVNGFYTQFAEGTSGGLFATLGINVKMLIFQIVGFLILVWLMGRYVYPILLKTLDARQENIEAGAKAASKAEESAKQAEADIEKTLDQARKDAADIITTARDEAAAAITAAEEKAKQRANKVLTDAQDQIEKDIVAARKALREETMDLVALATERVAGEVVSKSINEQLIKKSLEEVR